MKKQAEQSFGSTTIRRAWEPPEEVLLQRAVVETAGLQPEDLGVLAALLLTDPREPATAKDLAARLRAMGWKMSIDRFETIAKRLTKAGHMSRESVFDPALGRPVWVVQVYRNPANNRPYVAEGVMASSQVRAEIGENPVPAVETPSGTGKNPVSPGQSEIGENPVSGKTRVPDGHVSAGQDRNRGIPESALTPPHPPVVGTTPPSPPVTAEPSVAAGAGTGRGWGVRSAKNDNPAVDPIAEKAAVEFLLTLPAPFACGLRNAKRFAPQLLTAIGLLGWELGPELAKELTHKSADGLKDPSSAIGKRIADLRHRQVVLRDAVPAVPSARQPVILQEPDFKPVPAPAKVADLLASLRKPEL